MFSSLGLRLSIAFTILLSTVLANTCYWPDGSASTGSGYVACNSTASASACCSPNDACTTFGWCLGASGMAYRGGCTDSDWNSPACMASYCNGVKDDYQFLMNCNQGNYVPGETLLWCCSTNSAGSCCNNNFSLPYTVANGLTGQAFMPNVKAAAQVTITTTATASAATGSSTGASQSAISSVNSSSTITHESNSGVSTGAVAGAAVGCAIGGALLGAATAFLLLRHRNSPKPTEMPAEDVNGFSEYDSPKSPYPGPPAQRPLGNSFGNDQGNNYTPVTQYHHQLVGSVSEVPAQDLNYELDGEHRAR